MASASGSDANTQNTDEVFWVIARRPNSQSAMIAALFTNFDAALEHQRYMVYGAPPGVIITIAKEY